MSTRSGGFITRAAGSLAALLGVALSGCGGVAPAPVASAGAPSVTAATVFDDDATPKLAPATGADAGVSYPLSNAASADLAGTATAFATRNALYTPVRFADLPGWNTDNVAESWDAFRRSCAVLGAKPGWAAPCSAASSIDARDAGAVRLFFEKNFTAYQIRNVDKTARGVLTGYYEPILNGSRKYDAPYVYPVYGVPRDMLFLDQRRLPPNARGTAIAARIENRTVLPVTTVSTGNVKGVYALELGDSVPDIRDKKLRLRLDGNRIVPYYSRSEIERGRLNAPVLAYVEDPATLYSMQLQGAGKIRLPDGSMLRLAYAEQNGFAFNPPVASAGSKGRKILVRGVELDLEEGAVDAQAAPGGAAPLDDAPQSPLLRNAGNASDGPAAAASDSAGDDPDSPLLRGFNLASGAAAAMRPSRVSAPGTSGTSGTSAAASSDKRTGSAQPLSARPAQAYAFASSDPSYVFFRAVPDSPSGPIGALGVPLSAGRSAAIDPRTTPLGAPVFVSSSELAPNTAPVTRLLMAQDAGGAIRGAVRADFFFGTGPQAQAQASRMRQPTQMWVLLPKGLKIAAKETSVRVRGTPVAPTVDCVVSDPDLCVEDSH